MASRDSSVFISRLRNLPVMDVAGDQLGRVRDVIVQRRADGRPPRVKGLLVDLFAQHRIFISMARVRNVDPTQVVISGVLNTRRFERRESEILVIGDLFDRAAERVDRQSSAVVFDVAMQTTRVHEWELSEVAIRDGRPRTFSRRGHVTILDWDEVRISGLGDTRQGTEHLLAEFEDMKPADIARELHNMTPERRTEIANALDDQKLADALEELPEDEQVQLIQGFDPQRAADVLEEMDPDDAADLIGELAPEVAERLLNQMEPQEAKDVRRLL
ncbi:MAG: PRC-barrel domain-containing protein, partial [Microlunatus sp.]|nr:PRC-barrel domain-containing protein [Microlunatus sp.]